MSSAAALTQDELDLRFHALSQARRRSILRLVTDREVPAGEIAAAFDVTRTAVSQHFTVLKRAGLVVERRQGTRRFYRRGLSHWLNCTLLLTRYWAGALERGRALAEDAR